MSTTAIKMQSKVDVIVAEVCNHFEIPIELVMSDATKRSITYPRQVAIYLIYGLTINGDIETARLFGRNKKTTWHSRNNIRRQLDVDRTLRATIDTLKTRIEIKFNEMAKRN